MPITELLEANSTKYGNDVALVEVNPEVKEVRKVTWKEYELYGDQIIIGVMPEQFDPAALTEKEIRQKAREYVDRFMQPGKPSILSFNGQSVCTPEYLEELYEYSRKKASGVA